MSLSLLHVVLSLAPLSLAPVSLDWRAERPQEPAADLPDAWAVLDTVTGGLGGADAISKVKSRRATGTASFKQFEMEGQYTEEYRATEAGNLVHWQTNFEGFGKFENGTDGRVIWEKTPMGLVVKDGWAAAADFRRFNFGTSDWKVLYRDAKTVGRETIEGHSCVKLSLTPRLYDTKKSAVDNAPNPDLLWVDEATGHVIRWQIEILSQGTMMPMTFTERDYREVDGLLYAFEREIEMSGFTLLMKYDGMEHGTELPEEQFELSDEILRAVAEKEKEVGSASGFKVETVKEQHVATIRVKCKKAELGKQLAIILPEVGVYLNSIGAKTVGPPLCRYHSWGDEFEIEAGIAVAQPVKEKGRIKASTLPAGRTVIGWHVGPYERLGETHEKMRQWITDQGYETRAALWEIYWTDPGMEPDPAKWRTQLLVPIEEEDDDE